ncbi:hypothetical protein ACFLYR_08175 [Chloroflexota bacterium]
MKMKASIVAFLVLILAVGIIIVMSFNYDNEKRMIPLFIAIPTSIMLVVLLIGERYPAITNLTSGLLGSILTTGTPSGAIKGEDENTDSTIAEKRKTMLLMMGWLILFAVCIIFLGFLISIPIFVFAYFLIIASVRWQRAILYTIVIGLIVLIASITFAYGVFEGLLFGGYLSQL